MHARNQRPRAPCAPPPPRSRTLQGGRRAGQRPTFVPPTNANGSNSGTSVAARTLSQRLPPTAGVERPMQPSADRSRNSSRAPESALAALTSAHLAWGGRRGPGTPCSMSTLAAAVRIRSHRVCVATQNRTGIPRLRALGSASHNAVDSKNSVCIIRSRSTARKARDCSGIFSFSAVGQKLSRPQGSRHTASCAVLERAA